MTEFEVLLNINACITMHCHHYRRQPHHHHHHRRRHRHHHHHHPNSRPLHLAVMKNDLDVTSALVREMNLRNMSLDRYNRQKQVMMTTTRR